jgi:cytochrome c
MKRVSLAALILASVAVFSGPARAGGDPEAGKALFNSICTLCHTSIEHKAKVGPSLFAVVGRHSGTEPGYSYSDANKNSGITWTPDVLEVYLIKPQALVPGTKMGYAGQPDKQKRADIIAYLQTLHY